MNRQLNIQRYLQEAGRARVSVHLLIKRALHYRNGTENQCCAECRYQDEIKFTGEENARHQCEWIGHGKDSHADLKMASVCDFFGEFARIIPEVDENGNVTLPQGDFIEYGSSIRNNQIKEVPPIE